MQISNEEYQYYKPLLFSLGYRLLGSVVEAEDLVQETFLKISQIHLNKIEDKKAYLCKMMTNRCLDALKSARYNREQYVGPWNPEPLWMADKSTIEPSELIIQKEGLSVAYLRIMEHLKPDERAVLVLRDAFSFSYKEIMSITEKSESNCRKIYSRAKQKISKVENESLHYEQNQMIIERFIFAFQSRNLDDILKLLSEDIVLYSDGGGNVKAAIRPVATIRNVLALLYGIVDKVSEDFYFEFKNINGQPALVNYTNQSVHSTFSFYIHSGRIHEMYITMNPDKLRTPQ